MKIKNLVTSAAIISSVALLSTPAHAEGEVLNAFEHCGIGAAFFPNSGTAATISNVIWDLGTTAVSSQTSSPSSCAGSNVSAAIFIDKTYAVLEEQFVKGGGTHVSALMDIMECGVNDQQHFIEHVQSGLATSFSNESFSTETHSSKAKNMGALVDSAKASCNA